MTRKYYIGCGEQVSSTMTFQKAWGMCYLRAALRQFGHCSDAWPPWTGSQTKKQQMQKPTSFLHSNSCGYPPTALPLLEVLTLLPRLTWPRPTLRIHLVQPWLSSGRLLFECLTAGFREPLAWGQQAGSSHQGKIKACGASWERILN